MIWTSIHLLHSNKPLNRQQCNHKLPQNSKWNLQFELKVTSHIRIRKTKISIRKEAEVKIHRNRVTTRYESTDGRLRTWAFLIFDNDVIIVMAARWLPNNEEFFVGLVRLLEASESNLNSASYDNSEFLFRRLDAHEKTLSTLLTVLTKPTLYPAVRGWTKAFIA